MHERIEVASDDVVEVLRSCEQAGAQGIRLLLLAPALRARYPNTLDVETLEEDAAFERMVNPTGTFGAEGGDWTSVKELLERALVARAPGGALQDAAAIGVLCAVIKSFELDAATVGLAAALYVTLLRRTPPAGPAIVEGSAAPSPPRSLREKVALCASLVDEPWRIRHVLREAGYDVTWLGEGSPELMWSSALLEIERGAAPDERDVVRILRGYYPRNAALDAWGRA